MITKEQIENYRQHRSTTAERDAVCDLALEALELRALVPTLDECDAIEESVGYDFPHRDDCIKVKALLGRVRAWKGRVT